MSISANLVKELRERTGAGMMECKKALTQANGDIEGAIKILRETGLAKVAKKAGLVAAEGIVITKSSSDKKTAVIAEINCQTDFVGRGEPLRKFAEAVVTAALSKKTDNIEAISQSQYEATTIDQARHELINKLGENIQIRRIALVESTAIVGEYMHGGRIGVLVALSVDNAELAKDIAMHIAASNPQAISPKDVPAELIAKEKEIFAAQSASSGKPAEIIEKMVAGRITKFLSEISLEGQPFVKDPSKTVGSLLQQANAKVIAFVRFEVGEGIEKQVEDFAQAVRAQISGG